MSAPPSIARPTRHVIPTMTPARLRTTLRVVRSVRANVGAGFIKGVKTESKGVAARRDRNRGVGGEKRQRKSLRNEVHNANAVV